MIMKKKTLNTFKLLFTSYDACECDQDLFNACYELVKFICDYESDQNIIEWFKNPQLTTLSKSNLVLIKQYFKIYDYNLACAHALELTSGIRINAEQVIRDTLLSSNEFIDNNLMIYTIKLIQSNFEAFYKKYEKSFNAFLNHQIDATMQNFYVGANKVSFELDSFFNHIYYNNLVDLEQEHLFSDLKQTYEITKTFAKFSLNDLNSEEEMINESPMSLNSLRNFLNPESEWTFVDEELLLRTNYYMVFVFNHYK